MCNIFRRKTLVPVYHIASPANAKGILREGLISGRNPEKSQAREFADELFCDIGEREFGIKEGRKQIFAWALKEKVERGIAKAREQWGEQVVLEVQVDREVVKVTHQDLFSAANQIIVPIIRDLWQAEIEADRRERCPMPGCNIGNTSGHMLWAMRESAESPGYLQFYRKIEGERKRLDLLARTYWEIAMPLAGFNQDGMFRLYREMMERVSRIHSLAGMIAACGDETNAEAIIFTDKIPRRKIRVLEI